MLIIKEIIKKKGFTVTSFADKIGMTQVSLSRIINGNPTVDTLEKIAKALEVEVRDLFSGKNPEENDLFIMKDGKPVSIGKIDISKLKS
ncbi:helix-turn-helix domain-containing protein [Seonamhaeicola sp. MEBiC1930]|uniref:helix-turn-helix domain-containing protein n=1 Tax=Seonamhaeicola sp. MEBiC01930 TaxID=2976768 RepID=UPI0032551935